MSRSHYATCHHLNHVIFDEDHFPYSDFHPAPSETNYNQFTSDDGPLPTLSSPSVSSHTEQLVSPTPSPSPSPAPYVPTLTRSFPPLVIP